MTRVVYLIIAHTAPDQVARLARTLTRGSSTAHVVVHYDAAEAPPEILTNLERVQLVSPTMHGNWGGYSLAALLLHAITWTHRMVTYDWLVLISGQDYPIQPVEQIEHELAISGVDGFVRAVPINGDTPCGDGHCGINHKANHADCGECFRRYRYRFYELPLGPLVGPDPVRRWLGPFRRFNRAQRNLYLRIFDLGHRPRILLGVRSTQTPFASPLECYKGSGWFSLSQRAVSRLLAAATARPELLAYYRRTLIPDESLFHTLLCNDPQLRLENDDRRFILWKDAEGGSPELLRTEHLAAMRQSGAHFARKFALATDAAVLDALDAQIHPEQLWSA